MNRNSILNLVWPDPGDDPDDIIRNYSNASPNDSLSNLIKAYDEVLKENLDKPKTKNEKVEEKSMFDNVMNSMFGKIKPGQCRLSMNGNIAIKTSSGYKTYNMKTHRLVNCDNFVFNDIMDDMFFSIPTNHVKKGDIILISGAPCCVIEVVNKNEIKVLNFETNSIESKLPERHMIMGEQYFFSKIVSVFGNNFAGGKKSNMSKMMKMYMMTEMLKAMSGGSNGGANNGSFDMKTLMMMNMFGGANMFGNMGDMFSGMFDEDDGIFGDNDDDEEEAPTDDTNGVEE